MPQITDFLVELSGIEPLTPSLRIQNSGKHRVIPRNTNA